MKKTEVEKISEVESTTPHPQSINMYSLGRSIALCVNGNYKES